MRNGIHVPACYLVKIIRDILLWGPIEYYSTYRVLLTIIFWISDTFIKLSFNTKVDGTSQPLCYITT